MAYEQVKQFILNPYAANLTPNTTTKTAIQLGPQFGSNNSTLVARTPIELTTMSAAIESSFLLKVSQFTGL
jgi:hypothetical protein